MYKVLNILPLAALVVGDGLRILFANKYAEEMIQVGALALDGNGRLSSVGTNLEAKQLRIALEAATDLDDDSPNRPLISFVHHNSGGRVAPLIARVVPLSGTAGGQPGVAFDVHLTDEPAVLVLIVDPLAKVKVGHEHLGQLFGLTAAEVRVAMALANGVSLRRYAADADISMETARTQLKAVFAKTDTHRQSELVSMLLRLSLLGIGAL